MKKLITIFVLFLYAGIANAQTEEQTLEWLNVKKANIGGVFTDTMSEVPLEIRNEMLYATDGVHEKGIMWKDIKDIKMFSSQWYFDVRTSDKFKKYNFYIQFKSDNDRELCQQYVKAIKHLAKLKGAQLVDDDLFKD